MVVVAMATAVLAILSPITIPAVPVPYTLGLFAVILTAALLPPLFAVSSLFIYVLIGMVGLPVFSNYMGGFHVIIGPTGGFILGFFIVSALVSIICRKTENYPIRLGVALLSIMGLYLAGTLWYMAISGSSFMSGLLSCVIPFIVPDIVKAVLALILASLIGKRLNMFI